MVPFEASVGFSTDPSQATPVMSLFETAVASSVPTPTQTSGSGDGGEKLQEWSSLIGIVTAIVGNVFIALALNVQRYAHTRLHKERLSRRRRARAAMKRTQQNGQGQIGSYGAADDHGRSPNGNTPSGENGRESDPLAASFYSNVTTEAGEDDVDSQRGGSSSSYLKSPYWWLGQILITLGETGNFLAYGFASASIVSPLGVVALVSNCLIAPLMFNERFRHRDFWGVVIATGGAITVVLSSKTEEVKLKPEDVWDSITSLAFEIYMLVTILLILVLMWASPRYGRRTIVIDLGLVGLFGGYTVLATKGVSSMLSSTLWGAFKTPVSYVLIFILLGTAIMQIRYVNRALQNFDSTQVIPTQFVLFTLSVILGSAILYRDFEKTTLEKALSFIGGCLLTFFGVFLITSGRGQSSADDDDDCLSDTAGVEETIGLLDQDGNPQDMSDQENGEDHVSHPHKSSKRSGLEATGVEEPTSPGTGGGYGVPPLQLLNPTSIPDLGEDRSLTSNPWSEGHAAATPSATPRRGTRSSRTLSADTVMRGSMVISSPNRSNPATPMREGQSLQIGSPLDQPLTPLAKANTIGHSHLHHRTNPFISPSPLSSTVTTVMKDGFLRGDNKPVSQRPSIRRMRSMLRASLFFNDEGEGIASGSGIASDGNLVGRSDETGEAGSTRTRSRSMSDAIGDFFNPKRSKRKEGATTDVEEDEDEYGHESR